MTSGRLATHAGAKTVTPELRGLIRDDSRTREELLSHTAGSAR